MQAELLDGIIKTDRTGCLKRYAFAVKCGFSGKICIIFNLPGINTGTLTGNGTGSPLLLENRISDPLNSKSEFMITSGRSNPHLPARNNILHPVLVGGIGYSE